MHTGHHHTEPAELPEYRTLLVVDMRGFGSVPGRDQAKVTDAIPDLLRHAFGRCNLAWLWEHVLFQASTGDGYLLCFPSNYVPFLLNPLLPALQEELKFQNTLVPYRIRMRVSINVGPLENVDKDIHSRGSGDSRVETHRLLDSAPVRQLLDGAGAATCVAAIVSDRVFHDAIAPGYTGEDPTTYYPVKVGEKEYRRMAYLRVPEPSGDLLARGFAPTDHVDSDGAGATTPSDDPHGPIATNVTGPVAQSGSRINTGVDVSGGDNTITTVHGDQHQGPRYEGDGQIHVGGSNRGTIQQSWWGRRTR